LAEAIPINKHASLRFH